MNNVIKTKQPITKQWLLSNNFHYNKYFSDEDGDVYTYRFPVFKYGRYTTLECELRVVVNENEINIDVYDYNTRDKYAPFYYCEYGNFDRIMKIINTNIKKELKRLGTKERKE